MTNQLRIERIENYIKFIEQECKNDYWKDLFMYQIVFPSILVVWSFTVNLWALIKESSGADLTFQLHVELFAVSFNVLLTTLLFTFSHRLVIGSSGPFLRDRLEVLIVVLVLFVLTSIIFKVPNDIIRRFPLINSNRMFYAYAILMGVSLLIYTMNVTVYYQFLKSNLDNKITTKLRTYI